MPTLNFFGKEDEDRLSKYRNSNYYDFYKNNDEKDIYDTAKVLRTEAGLPKAKFDPQYIESYQNIINTKPRAGSILASALPSLDEEDEEEFGVLDGLKGLAKGAGKWAGERGKDLLTGANEFVGRAVDVVDEPLKRTVASTSSLGIAAIENSKELFNSIREDRDFDFLRAGEKWEEKNRQIEYMFGLKNDTSDILNFKTAEEKRKEILDELPIEERKKMQENLGGAALFTDVTAGIMSGILTGGATKLGLTALATKGGKIGKLATATSKVLDKTPTAMAKLGALNVASAVPYYAATGEWIFGDNQAATQGAAVTTGALLFKSVGKFLSRKQVDKIVSNPEYQKGVEKMTQQLKEEGVIVTPKITKGTVEEKAWRKSMDELQTIQSEGKFYKFDDADAGYTPKFDIVKKGVDDGLVEFKGIDEGHMSFQFSDELGRLKFGKKYDPSRPIMVHYPIEDWNKLGGKNFDEVVAPATTNLNKVVDDAAKQADADVVIPPSEFIKQINKKQKQSINVGEKFNNAYNKFTSIFVNNKSRVAGELLGDHGITKTLGAADRRVRDVLDAENFNKKSLFIKRGFEKFQRLTNDEFNEFDAYVGAKSRLNQIAHYESKNPGKKLNTTIKIDGKDVPYTKAQMEAIVKEYEGKFGDLSKNLDDLNKQVLEYEEMAGIKTQEQIDNYLKANPNYIPAKLDDDVTERIMTGKMRMSEMVDLSSKELRGGSEKLAFSQDHINNAYKHLMARMHIAAKNNKVNVLRSFDEAGIIKEVKRGEIIKEKGYETVEVFVNGERKLMAMPKPLVEFVEDTDALSNSLFMKFASVPATYVKSMATGKFAPVFQILNAVSEAVNGTMHAFQRYGASGAKDFAKNMFTGLMNGTRASKLIGGELGDFTKSRAGIEAVNGLMEFFGGSYSKINLIQDEFLGVGYKKLQGEGNSALNKGFKAVNKALDFGTAIEKYSSRMPMFQVGLKDAFKKAGVDISEFDDLVKKAGFDGQGAGSITKLNKLLLEKGIDPRIAGSASKGIFNYTVASRAVRNMSRIFPYLSTSVSGTTAVKELFERNPKKMLAIVSSLYALADTMVAYNSGKEGMLGLLQPDEEKQRHWEGAPDWMKHSLGFQSFSDEEMVNTPLFKNVSILNWIYPIVSEQYSSKLGGEAYDWNGALGKVMKDVTYFIDSSKSPFDNFKQAVGTIAAIKPAVEVAFNEDLFTGGSVHESGKDGRYSEYPIYDNKGTSQIDKNIALWITAIKNKSEGLPLQDETGLIRGGVSPRAVARMFRYLDPQDKIRKLYEKFASEDDKEGTGRRYKNFFLTRVYNNNSLLSNLYADDKDFTAKQQQNTIIREAIKRAGSNEEVGVQIKNLLKMFGDDKKKRDVIADAIKDRAITDFYGKEFSVMESMGSNEKIARYLDRTYSKQEIVEKLTKYNEMSKAGLTAKNKVKSIAEELVKLELQKKTQGEE